jgi:hypothetical protein
MITRFCKSWSRQSTLPINKPFTMSRYNSSKLHPSKKVATQETDVWTITYNTPAAPELIEQEYSSFRDKSAANSLRTRIYEVYPLFVDRLIVSFKPPEFLVQAAKDALDDVGANQYSHTRGRPRLRQALAKAYSPFFGRPIDPDTVLLIGILECLTNGRKLSSRRALMKVSISNDRSKDRHVLCVRRIP